MDKTAQVRKGEKMKRATLVGLIFVSAIFFIIFNFKVGEGSQLISRIYVGEFELGSSKLDESLVRQIFAGLSKLPNSGYSVKLSAYTDNSGSEEANKQLSQERLEAVALTLREINPKISIVESVGYIYKAGQNEVDRRFCVIEFWGNEGSVVTPNLTFPVETSNWVTRTVENEGVQKEVFENILGTLTLINKDAKEIRELISGLQAQNAAILEDTALINQKVDSFLGEIKKTNNFIEVLDKFRKFFLLAILGSLLLLVAIFVAYKKVSKKVVAIESGAEERHEEVVTILTKLQKSKEMKITGTKDFTVDALGKIYRATCQKAENENGDTCIYSPFKTTTGRDIIRADTPSMIRSLRGCLKKNEYEKQKKALIDRGIIVVIGGQK
jgi:hypothetical protein